MKEIENIFNGIEEDAVWSIDLLNVHSSKREGVVYSAHRIQLDPSDFLKRHVLDLRDKYCLGNNSTLKKFSEIVDYDGTAESILVYRIKKDSELISTEYDLLFNAIGTSNKEGNPFEKKQSAYVISGVSNGKKVYFFTIQSPFINMSKKAFWKGGKFVEMTEPILSLRSNIDVIIYDENVFLMTMAGENLFQLERAYKKVCSYRIQEIGESGIIDNIEMFNAIASAGNNPRKFVSYNEHYLDLLKKKKTREKIGAKFGIPLSDGKFVTTDKKAVNDLVKLLCKKGMLDPFDDNPVEVSGARDWSK